MFEHTRDEWNHDNAIYDDGEWITWTEINQHLEYQEWSAKYPNANRDLIPIFESLMETAEDFHMATGKHLQAYGDIGELFGAITYGIALNRDRAQGSDGRLGNDFVEVKTITPFKSSDMVEVKTTGNFSKLLIVKITQDFEIACKMVDRRDLPKPKGSRYRIRWQDVQGG